MKDKIRKHSRSESIDEDYQPLARNQRIDTQENEFNDIKDNWQLPDELLMKSINNVFSIAISKTINKAIKDEVPRDERHRISKELSNSWNQSLNPKSFRSRLNVTRLPTSLKLQFASELPSESIQVGNQLNFKELEAKQKVLDAYLTEEMRQLNDLKQYLSESEQGLARDHAKLAEYKDANQDELSALEEEVKEMKRGMSLDQFVEGGADVISLTKHEHVSDFDPNRDSDVSGRIQQLEHTLRTIHQKISGLRTINDRLESIYNLLE